MRILTIVLAIAGLVVGLFFARSAVAERVRRFRLREEPFRVLADAAPIMMRLSDADRRCTFVNRGWLDFRGRLAHEELGGGWMSGVHEADRRGVRDAYRRAISEGSPFSIVYRVRRRDGEYRWILDSAAPWRKPGGRLAGFIAAAIDISDWKQAEDTLRDLGGRLIAAQEEERGRIARDLHDDVSQRLTLLSVELEHLGLRGQQSGDARDRWQALARTAANIATDLHQISHRLHPSRLHALGLVAAIGGFCQELWSQHHLQVHFTHDAVPSAIPADVALCCYRIVQEALNNVITHSRVLEAEVHLAGTNNGLLLRITDQGSGFAPERREGTGLGLLSMRERVRSVGGDLVVQAAPGRGTRIGVRINLQPTNAHTRPALPLTDLSI
jgi:PAS domain S-box-containing protein